MSSPCRPGRDAPLSRITVGVVGSASWTHAGRDAHPADLPGVPDGFHPAPGPDRPGRFSPGSWRRMSRLARLCAAAADPLLDHDPGCVIVGLMGGEFASGVAFLRSLAQGLPSPLAFQNAVHNAPAAWLSIDAGLRGRSETLMGGPHVVWDAIERAACRVLVHGETVLVVVADELGPEVRAGLEMAGAHGPWGESAAALLLAPTGGHTLTLHDGAAPGWAWGRAASYPGEPARPRVDRAWDTRLGLGPGSELATLAALVRTGGAIARPDRWLEVA